MNKEPLINFIKQNIPNISIDKNALLTIAEQFEEKHFQKNDYLLKMGKVSDYFYSGGRVVFDASSFFYAFNQLKIFRQ